MLVLGLSVVKRWLVLLQRPVVSILGGRSGEWVVGGRAERIGSQRQPLPPNPDPPSMPASNMGLFIISTAAALHCSPVR